MNDLANVRAARYWTERAEKSTDPAEAQRFYRIAAEGYATTVRETDRQYDTSRGVYAINALRAAALSGDRAFALSLAAEYTGAAFVPSPFTAKVLGEMAAKLRAA